MAEQEKDLDEGGRLQRAGVWGPTHSAMELDVYTTFSAYDTFIPGVTTQRQTHRPDPRAQRFQHTNLLVDVSCSMGKGVSAKFPLDVKVKLSDGEPWRPFRASWKFTDGGIGLWNAANPLMPDSKGPHKGYPLETATLRGSRPPPGSGCP